MGIKNGYFFDRVYEAYLVWFHDKALSTVKPKDKEELLKYQIMNEDVFESSTVLLNRVYFSVPVFPGESQNGKFEYFSFSELNLMLKVHHDDKNEITGIIPVEYRIE